MAASVGFRDVVQRQRLGGWGRGGGITPEVQPSAAAAAAAAAACCCCLLLLLLAAAAAAAAAAAMCVCAAAAAAGWGGGGQGTWGFVHVAADRMLSS